MGEKRSRGVHHGLSRVRRLCILWGRPAGLHRLRPRLSFRVPVVGSLTFGQHLTKGINIGPQCGNLAGWAVCRHREPAIAQVVCEYADHAQEDPFVSSCMTSGCFQNTSPEPPPTRCPCPRSVARVFPTLTSMCAVVTNPVSHLICEFSAAWQRAVCRK